MLASPVICKWSQCPTPRPLTRCHHIIRAQYQVLQRSNRVSGHSEVPHQSWRILHAGALQRKILLLLRSERGLTQVQANALMLGHKHKRGMADLTGGNTAGSDVGDLTQ